MVEQLEWYSLLSFNHIPQQLWLIACIVFCVGTVVILWVKGVKRGWRYSMALLLAELLLLIYSSTVFFRETNMGLGREFNPFRNYQSTQAFLSVLPENILNMVLFVPVGFLFGVVFRQMTWRKVMITGAGLSMSIEILQLILQKGICDFNDLLCNTLGCMIGYGFFRLIILSKAFLSSELPTSSTRA